MENDEKDESFEVNQHNRVLAKEEKQYEQLKQRVEAANKHTVDVIKQALQNDQSRQNLAREAYKATSRYNSGEDQGLRMKINKYNQLGGVFTSDEEVISGMEERPWERE